MALNLRGVIPAAITPMNPDCSINYEDLKKLIEGFIGDGASGIQCVAHAGEVVKLDRTERRKVIETIVETVAGRVPVIAGLSSEYDLEAVDYAREIKSIGADAVMVLPPWHVFGSLSGVMGRGGSLDPTGEMNYSFHKQIADEAEIPIVLFNYGPSSVCGYTNEALAKLCTIDQVIGIKVICSSMYQFQEIAKVVRNANPKVSLLSADDLTLYYALVHGADGALVGIANLKTKMWVDMFNLIKACDFEGARKIHEQLSPIMIATHDPIMVHVLRIKEALYQLGLISSATIRKPPVPTHLDSEIVAKALKDSNLL